MTTFTVLANQLVFAVLCAAVLLVGLYERHTRLAPGRSLHLSVLVVVFIAFYVLAVAAFWEAGASPFGAVAGLLPVNDPNTFFACSYSILDGGALAPHCARRPLYSVLLSVIVLSADRDLQAALLIQAFLVGAALSLLVVEIARRWRLTAGISACAFLFALQAILGPMTLSVHAGLLWGALAAILLLRWSESGSFVFGVVGVFLLTIALNARAGAFLVLPLIFAWCLWFPEKRWRRAGAVALGIASGFVLNVLVGRLYGGGADLIHSNFSYTLYGLAAGGKGWFYVFTDQAEALSAASGVAAESRLVYRLAIEKIFDEPHLLFFGYAKGLVHYFYALFRFIEPFPVRALFVVFWFIGVYRCFVRIRQPMEGLIAAIVVGVLISAPFITFDGGSRVYAATFPIDAALIGMGVFYLLRRGSATSLGTAAQVPLRFGLPGAAISLGVLTTAVLWLPLVLSDHVRLAPLAQTVSCPEGENGWVFRLGWESPFVIVSDGPNRLFPLTVPQQSLVENHDVELDVAPKLGQVAQGDVLVWIYGRGGNFGGRRSAVLHGLEDPRVGDVVAACVQDPRRLSRAEGIRVSGRAD